MKRKVSERGQVLMMSALLAPVLLAMAGMAVDVGGYASDRRSLQNSADSIALAAGQELPDEADAIDAGESWATKNGIDLADVMITVSGGDESPTVTVQINRDHDFAFMQIVGIDSSDVGARAVVQKVSFGGGSGIVPWAVTQATVDAASNGTQVVMKYDATGVDNGNFGAIRIDGSGSSTYNTSVRYGSSTVACAETSPNCVAGACPGTYPSTCAETAPECDGPDCAPQTGNMVGNTRTGVDFRMNNTMASCNEFNEAFPTQSADGKYQLNPDCNPWTDGPGKCLTTTSLCSRRVIIIPVVEDFGNGTSDVLTVTRFALIWLDGWTGWPDPNLCTGNTCEISGRFVWADINANALAGTYDPEASIHFARLTE